MNNYNGESQQSNVSSNALLGAALGDGATAGLIGGIVGAILPVIGIFTGNANMSAYAVIADILIYIITGILAGYLFYSRKIGRGWSPLVAGIIGGLFAGGISGALTGLSLGRLPELASQVDTNLVWATWGILSGLGAAFIGALTVWIPGLFFKSEAVYNAEPQTPGISEKELSQYEQVGQRFKKRMQTRLVIGIASIAIIFACYFCQSLVQ